ncbi:MAG: hypothetical protein RBR08_14340 [Desulforegulaceae bacterium]|nr:hypothetical protein [Desulforegulaceae bacterium]
MKTLFVSLIFLFCFLNIAYASSKDISIFVVHSYQKGQGCGAVSEKEMVYYLNKKFGSKITIFITTWIPLGKI